MIKTIVRRISHFFTQPRTCILNFVTLTKAFWPDKLYLSILFWGHFGKKMSWKNPLTFNEKLQWLKLYNRRPEYSMMVDKVKVKDYVASVLGEEYVIPTIGVWDDPSKIDFDALPKRFVMKCNHNSGLGMYICKDKSKMDVEAVKAGLRYGLNEDYFKKNREWPYKNVPRRIFAEQYLEPDGETNDLRDYKFFCFNGKVKCFKIDYNRQVDHHANYYSREGVLLPFGEKDFPPQPDKEISIPHSIKKMIELAEIIADGHYFMRVDFYDHNGRIYFGEITFFPASGFGEFTSNDWDEKLGTWLLLPLVQSFN